MGGQALKQSELVIEFRTGLRVPIRSVDRGDEHAVNGRLRVAALPVGGVAWQVQASYNGSPPRDDRHAVPAPLTAAYRMITRLPKCLRRELGVRGLGLLQQTMSGSASRSQFSRFVKRRLMLLMLKLAIFIG